MHPTLYYYVRLCEMIAREECDHDYEEYARGTINLMDYCSDERVLNSRLAGLKDYMPDAVSQRLKALNQFLLNELG